MLCSKKVFLFSVLLSASHMSKAATTVNTPFVSLEVWETHVDRLLNDEPQLEELYTKEASLYHFAEQECRNVLTMLQQNAELFKAQVVALAEAKQSGVRNAPLFDEASRQMLFQQMKEILDNAKDKIALVTKEIEFLTTYRNELKLVYQGIISQGVTRAAHLEKGIERLETVFDSALEAKKKFLDAVFLLAHEAEEMVALVASTNEVTPS
jgi:hypothetical protein